MTGRYARKLSLEQAQLRRRHALGKPSEPDEAELWKQRIEDIHVIDDEWRRVQGMLNGLIAQVGVANAEGRCLTITGQSGAGKSHIIKRFVRRPNLQPTADDHGPLRPLLYIEVPTSCTAKYLGAMVCQALTGQLPPDTISVAKTWDQALAHLVGQGVCVLVLDEVHHAFQTLDKRRQTEFINTFKSLLFPERDTGSARPSRLPLQIVLGGLPQIASVIATDTQLADRQELFAIEAWRFDEAGLEKMGGFLEAVEPQLGFPKPSKLHTRDMALRFFKAGDGHHGRAMRLIKYAASDAIDAGRECLTREDLGLALFSKYNCPARKNPFLVPDAESVPVMKSRDRSDLTRIRGSKNGPQTREGDND